MAVKVEVQQGTFPITVIEFITDVPAKGAELLSLLEWKMRTFRDKADEVKFA